MYKYELAEIKFATSGVAVAMVGWSAQIFLIDEIYKKWLLARFARPTVCNENAR